MTADEYRDYQFRFARGMEGLSSLSAHGELFLSALPCDICYRPLGGYRRNCSALMSSADPEETDGEITEVEACQDCLFFHANGQLDDGQMLEASGEWPSQPTPDYALPRIETTTLHTWFEHDRAHIELRGFDGETLVEWWDEAVQEAQTDGFLGSDPRQWHQEALDYYLQNLA